MIAALRGEVLSKEKDRVVLEAGGVGYEVFVTLQTGAGLAVGETCLLHVAESFGLYGGGQTLYGFLDPVEKAMFLSFRESVPSTGAKKALEYLEKASKSLPDFRRAILDKDAKLLTGVFGFSKKTADRLIDALKDKLDAVTPRGQERIARAAQPQASAGALAQALSALTSLGYKAAEARSAVQSVAEETSGRELEAEDILRLALKRL